MFAFFEVNAVFNGEPVELLEESTWTAGLRRTGNDTGTLQLDPPPWELTWYTVSHSVVEGHFLFAEK